VAKRGAPDNADAVSQLLSWPEQVRGYGVVKMTSIAEARKLREAAHKALG
jgi:hypothetical protein